MIGGFIGESCQRVLNGIVRLLARLNPNPNLLSVIGLGTISSRATLHVDRSAQTARDTDHSDVEEFND